MRRLFIVLLLTIVFFAEAATHCESLDQYVNFGYDVESVKNAILANLEQDFRQQCEQATGSSDIFFYSGEWVNTCEGQSDSKNGYIKSITRCDFCDGANIQLQLQIEENACNAGCKKKNTTCMRMASGWGGEIVKINPNGGDCGAYDPTLPNCSESSSSESEQSSSSEIQSSSSVESSSSDLGSSSSEEKTESSSSEDFDSSSSEENDDSSSSEGNCGEGGDHCGGSSGSGGGGAYCQIDDDNWETLSRLPNIHRDIYFEPPYMINRDYAYLLNCYCTGTRAVACDFANFGLVQGYEPVSMPLCGLREGYWCRGISDGACDYTGVTTRIYYSDSPESVGFSWGAANFDNSGSVLPIETDWQTVFLNHNGIISHQFSIRHLLPTNVLYYDLENMVHEALPAFPDMNKLVAYCMGEWVPHDDDCFGTEDEVNLALQDSSDECAVSYGIPHYETDLSSRGWCVVGECEAAEPYSSAEELSSSSAKNSSSSFGETSSSEEEISSSEESSSSEELSSSSEFGLCKSLPFGYIPDDPKNTCFESNGKCYRCNAARRADECDKDWMWIYPYTPDKYFFTEIDCTNGERKDNNRVGQCPGFPMEDLPHNPEKACIAHNGKCYRCKSENSYVDCSLDWLWIGDYFGSHNIGWWYEEVDCDNPFEENDDELIVNVCVDESVLRKQAAKEYYRQYEDSSIEYSVDLTKPEKKFDALGRDGIIKQSSHMMLYQKNMSMPQRKNETSVVLQIPSVSSADYCDRDFSGRWNCNRNKNGLEKRVWSVDKFVDPIKCNIKKGRDYWYFTKNTDPETGKEVSRTYVGGITCAWPNVTVNHEPKSQKNELIYSNGKIVGAKAIVEYRFYTHTTLGENNHIVMKTGDVFSDGHVVTEKEESTYEKHELGHEFYNECVSYDEIEETGTFECTVKISGTMSIDKRTKILNDAVTADLTAKRNLFEKQHLQDRLNKAQEKLDKSRDLFHANFGTDGYAGKNDKLPKSYVCPNF